MLIESLDVRTLAFVATMVFFPVTAVLALVYFTHRVYAGFGHWLAWQMAVNVGVLLFALRGAEASPVNMLSTNLLLLTAPAVLFDGLARFHGLYNSRLPVLSNYALVAAALLLQVWFTAIAPDANSRIAVFSITRAIIQFRCAFEPLRVPAARRSPAFWSLAVMLIALSVNEVRHAWLGLQPEPITDLMHSTEIRVALIIAIVADVIAAYGLLLLTTERVEADLRSAQQDIEKLARTDSLTGLWNRRHFEEVAEAEIARARRYGTPLSLLILDADHFKRVNDRFGHQQGDTVLREIAELVSTQIRRSDVLCRWGGEEFMILAPATGGDQAAAMAEKIRGTVAGYGFTAIGTMTVSVGVGQLTGHDDTDTWLRRVDAALYDAKQRGRNRVMVADPAVLAAS